MGPRVPRTFGSPYPGVPDGEHEGSVDGQGVAEA
jgi:hypothetical protein